jgi:hypothetical protein
MVPVVEANGPVVALTIVVAPAHALAPASALAIGKRLPVVAHKQMDWREIYVASKHIVK